MVKMPMGQQDCNRFSAICFCPFSKLICAGTRVYYNRFLCIFIYYKIAVCLHWSYYILVYFHMAQPRPLFFAAYSLTYVHTEVSETTDFLAGGSLYINNIIYLSYFFNKASNLLASFYVKEYLNCGYSLLAGL